jgi:hypothetical protein
VKRKPQRVDLPAGVRGGRVFIGRELPGHLERDYGKPLFHEDGSVTIEGTTNRYVPGAIDFKQLGTGISEAGRREQD